MNIDLTKLLNNQISSLKINDTINIPKELYQASLIDDLLNLSLSGKVTFDEENNLILTGTVKGTMVLKDDLTLEPVEHHFTSDLEEILDKSKNILDITDILWQNILVEIPSKVRATNEDIELSGDGWRVISEETFLNIRKNANNPFANLEDLLKTKEEK